MSKFLEELIAKHDIGAEEGNRQRCPKCDGLMVARSSSKENWGCSNYPQCKQTVLATAMG